jgi:phosphoribosylformimino-5-aminoimidazole carboxamide ribotide isomerase
MILYPAIDLKQGKCVRLLQGDFNQMTLYDIDAIQVAKNYAKAGAHFLHVVDLDGAQNGAIAQLDLMLKIQNETGLQLQVGGGIREKSMLKKLIDSGISRVILGSIAVKDPQQVCSWIEEYGPEQIVLAFDIKMNEKNDPIAFVHGWETASQANLWELLAIYQKSALKNVLCTDISLDGTLQGPNFNLYTACKKRYPHIAFQASGGIASLKDLHMLQEISVAGAIVGKALYEEKFTLEEALQRVKLC